MRLLANAAKTQRPPQLHDGHGAGIRMTCSSQPQHSLYDEGDDNDDDDATTIDS